MWREGWLVLTAQKSCGMACETTEDYISCVDDVPLARNIVRGRAKGTHSKLSFFDTSLLDPLLEQHSQAAEAEGEGYLPLSGGSKSVGPDWLGALVSGSRSGLELGIALPSTLEHLLLESRPCLRRILLSIKAKCRLVEPVSEYSTHLVCERKVIVKGA